ncbi:MAG TPA: hypothetical protein VEN28_08105 [Burkholderiaceae bacterium]|nr:hypothetical protein [Burkholderiaceae bacterium]
MRFAHNLLLGVLALVLLACTPARGAEIVLERTAVDRLVRQSLFTDQGRYYLQRGACYAYLDEPAVTLTGGRLVLNANLTSFLGVMVGVQCIGVPLNSKVTLSGKPAQQGGTVRLADLRIDNITDQATRALVQSVVMQRFPQAVEIDVASAVRSMLKQPNIPYTSDLERLDITAVSAEGDRLGVTFDFKLTAK